MPEEGMKAGSVSVYTLRSAAAVKTVNGITVDKLRDGLLVKANTRPVFFYHTREAMPPVDSPTYYRRSGFIHPLYSPAGKIMTDDFPAGHAHQHAIFMAWVNAGFRTAPVDFWNQQSKKGTVEHVDVVSITEGPVLARLRLRLRHRSLQHGEVLQELWSITTYSFPGYYLIDLESEQQNVTADTLFLNKYHYGGMGFRGSREWNPDDKKNFDEPWHILTSEGSRDTMANQTHARWVDASGKVGGHAAGVTVFNHPRNFRYPQAIRVHPTMPYWCYAPVIDGKFMIAPGSKYVSRFRYLVYDGPPSPELIEKIEKDYAEPPVVRVIP
jgi:hypothetical protein